jgi:hypothetical protein
VEETTENVGFDGSIESAISAMIEPESTQNEEPSTSEIDDSEDENETGESNAESDDDSEESESAEDSDDEGEDDAQDEEEDTDSADKTEPVFTVKVDGTEKQVTLDELKRGYSGQQFVQKGMQEAAAQRKQAEEVYAALLNERQQIAQLYQQIQGGQIATPPKAPSRELFDSDPIGYMEAKLNYDEQVAQYQQQQSQFEQLSAQQSQAQQAARQAYLQQEVENLKSKVPELANPAVAGKFKEQLLEAGSAYGYTAEEISQVVESRALHVLRDAMKYREIMSGKKKADEKAQLARPKTAPIKAGSKKLDKSNKAVLQSKTKLKNTGRVEDAISLMFNS